MSVQQPAWLKRTRPCPFFSQGRCLFADSCNFRHDVKVRNTLNGPLHSASQAEQPSFYPKPVFDPPSVVVNSASPHSVILASPDQDSLRYSGLLSVLSDVIGPPSNSKAVGDATRTSSVTQSSSQNIAYGPTGLPLEPNLITSNSDPASAVADTHTGQASSGCSEPSSTLCVDSQATLASSSGYQTEPCLPQGNDELVAEFLPVLDEAESADGDTTSYFMGNAETHAIGSEHSDEVDTGGLGEEDFTVAISNRQSTLSSFTGASLLASPRNSVFGEFPVHGSVEGAAIDLLSPVQLSAKLRPFPISSLNSGTKRGDSIDSGYADGVNWVGPLPFPRSPPRSFQSPVTFPSHSRQASRSFFAPKESKLSHDFGAARSPRYSAEDVEFDLRFKYGSEDNEGSACSISDTYDKLPSEERGRNEARDLLQVDHTVVTEDKTKEVDVPPAAVKRNLRQYFLEHLHPTSEYDIDTCNQPSFVSDDNLSFKTALSAQPSYEDFSDVSKVSPVRPDSLFSLTPGCSTRDTSVLSHYSDAKESSGCPIAYGHSSCVTTGPENQFDSTDAPGAKASEESSLLESTVTDSNTLSTFATPDEPPSVTPGHVTLQEPLSSIFHFRRSPSVPGVSVDFFSPLSAGDSFTCAPIGADIIREFAPQNVALLQGDLDGNPSSLSPSAEISHGPLLVGGTCSPVCPDINNLETSQQNDVVPQEVLPDISHNSQCPPKSTSSTSCEGALGFVLAVVDDLQEATPGQVMFLQGQFCDASSFNEPSVRLNSLEESFRSSSVVESIAGRVLQGVSGGHSEFPTDVVALPEHVSGDVHFGVQEICPGGVVGPMVYPSGALSPKRPFPRPSPTAEGLCSLCPAKDPRYTPPSANTGESEADQSLIVEDGLESTEVLECFDSEDDVSTQRLSFPLPPAFWSAESAGYSTFNDEGPSALPDATVTDFGEGASRQHTTLRQEKVQRMHSGSDLTERVHPSQSFSFGFSNSDAEFTLRRSRALSDLTVKGKSSPMTIHENSPNASKSPSLPPEHQGRVDPVQSLYDQYFDDDLDDGPGLSYPTHKVTAHPDMPNAPEEFSGEAHLQSLDFISQMRSPSCSHNKPDNSSADSQRLETVLRPLLTRQKSFLRSSLVELFPKANPGNVTGFSSARPSIRLHARDIGSTVVPLGFRRHKPQPVGCVKPSRTPSQPLHTVVPASQPREVLRIRTDIVQEDLPQACSSATHVPSAPRSPLPVQSMSAPPTGGLKQLHLSSVIDKRSSILSTHSSSILSLDHLFNSSSPQSPSVSSTSSFSRNSLPLTSCKQIPEQVHHTPQRSRLNSSVPQAINNAYSTPLHHNSRSVSPPIQQSKSWRLSHYRAGSRNYTPVDDTRRLSKRTSMLSLPYAVDEEQELDEDSPMISHPIQSNHANGWTRPAPVITSPVHAIATPKPTLLFAIASDDVGQVRQVLESGEAGPNDSVGPQSALAFTLTNDKLANKPEIVKALLAYGANPSALQNPILNPAPRTNGANEPNVPPPETTLDGMDPATRYFVARADAAHTRQTSQLIYRSFFRPLTRVRYDVIGQDWALEQLFRALSMHSQKLAVAPIVVLLCGPSGHGKSLLARKFGFLLDVPTHTVNMTTLRSAHDIWQSYSMSPYEEPSSCTLAEFLTENEGKRCVVVLDEIEKVEDQKALWSLLMPWELGRCSLEAGKRHVDARNVIWLATSNVGHELVFEYDEKRAEPDSRMSRENYLELTALLRPRVSHCLGASLVSRVTTVLPFVPFTLDEKKAIAAEAVHTFAGKAPKMSPQEVESLVMKALSSYHPSEGARSLHRAISNILMDTI